MRRHSTPVRKPSALPSEAGRRRQQHEFHSFLLGVVDFFLPGGEFFPAPTIDDVGLLRPQAQGGPGGVHGDVAAPKGGNLLAPDQGSVVIGEVVGLHQVGTGQIFIGRIDADVVLAGNLQEHGQPGADPEKYCIKALQELIHRFRTADDGVDFDGTTQAFQIAAFGGDNSFGETEFGDAVDQDAARGRAGPQRYGRHGP